MALAPRQSLLARSATPLVPVADGFTNFAAAMGLQARNVSGGGSYTPQYLTLAPRLLEQAYRGSWIVAAGVDIPAEDMTRAGIDIDGDLEADEKEAMQAALRDMAIWQRIASAEKWGRLFGGAVAIIMIKGQNPTTPLNIERLKQGSFEGLIVMDRWVLNPVIGSIVTDFGVDWGKPEFYETVTDQLGGLPKMRVHHSRVLRFEGYELPWYQRIQNMGWGESVIERIWDRIQAFDSSYTGAAQLLFKAYLRTVKIDGFRDVVAAGGAAMQGVVAQFETMRLMQSLEGLSLLDAKDDFETHQYNFGGISDIMVQQGEQLAGALEIPTVRLFGQSPKGMNATGESDLRTYYDGILKKQEAKLRRPMTVLLDVLHRSLFGRDTPPGFSFRFRPLWQISDTERADIALKVTQAVTMGVEQLGVHASTGLKELRQSSTVTGLWGLIDDDEIKDAESLPPLSETEGLAHESAQLGVEGMKAKVAEPDKPDDAGE